MSATLLDALLAFASFRLADHPAPVVYQAVADTALGLVAGADLVAITVGSRAGLEVVATAGAPADGCPAGVVEPADEAVRADRVIHAGGDLTPWPALRKDPAGVSDLVAQPLALGSRRPGALIYLNRTRIIEPADLAVVDALGGPASVAVANATDFDALRQDNAQLTEGLRSREAIGLAKGILMRQETCTEGEAFQILAAASQRLNRKVRDVARDLIALTEGRAEQIRPTNE